MKGRQKFRGEVKWNKLEIILLMQSNHSLIMSNAMTSSGENWASRKVLGSNGIFDWGTMTEDWSTVTEEWSAMSKNWSSMAEEWSTMTEEWGTVSKNWSGNDWSSNNWNVATVQVGSSWILFNINAGFVSLNGSTETESIGNIADNTHTTISITKAVGANLNTWAALFLTERTTGSVIFIITEVEVAITVVVTGDSRCASVHNTAEIGGCNGGQSKNKEELHD